MIIIPEYLVCTNVFHGSVECRDNPFRIYFVPCLCGLVFYV